MLIGVTNVKISLKERHVHFFYIQRVKNMMISLMNNTVSKKHLTPVTDFSYSWQQYSNIMRTHIGAANANTSNRVQIGAREETFSVVKYIVDPSRISSVFFSVHVI